jgi:hypothetical protein
MKISNFAKPGWPIICPLKDLSGQIILNFLMALRPGPGSATTAAAAAVGINGWQDFFGLDGKTGIKTVIFKIYLHSPGHFLESLVDRIDDVSNGYRIVPIIGVINGQREKTSSSAAGRGEKNTHIALGVIVSQELAQTSLSFRADTYHGLHQRGPF